MRIADGVEVLEFESLVMGRPGVIHPTVLWDADGLILIDTGSPGQRATIVAAMQRAGLDPSDLRRILLTHQDLDHVGSLPEMATAGAGPVQVLASAVERPYIDGTLVPLKSRPEAIERAVAALEPDASANGPALRADLTFPRRWPVDVALVPGQELPWCGGISVVDTAGHTPGHVAFYHRASRTLIAGDALWLLDGELVGSLPALTWDQAMAARSLRNLAPHDIATVVCYHGGVYRGDANARIAALARSATP